MSRTTTVAGANFLASGFQHDPREQVLICNATLPPRHRQIQRRDPAAARRRSHDPEVVFASPAGYHYLLQQRLRRLGFAEEERRIVVEHDPEEESILIFDAISPPQSEPDLAGDQWFRTTPASDSAVEALERVETGAVTEDCTICLEGMVGSSDGGGTQQQLVRMPCDHLFHESCAVSWLKTSNVCPLCRFQIPPADP